MRVEAHFFKPKIKFDTRILSVIGIYWIENHLIWYTISCFPSPIQHENLILK